MYQLAESSLPDWLPSPCLFFAVRFILFFSFFYSQASNTRARPQVDTYIRTGVAVSSGMTSSIDKSTQVSSGCLVEPPYIRSLPSSHRDRITCVNITVPDTPVFIPGDKPNRVFDMHNEVASIVNPLWTRGVRGCVGKHRCGQT